MVSEKDFMVNGKVFRIDVFTAFARSKSEAIQKFRRSKKVNVYASLIKADMSKISQATIEEDKGRKGNWNDYVREFENIRPKKSENWYEYGLNMNTIPKKVR